MADFCVECQIAMSHLLDRPVQAMQVGGSNTLVLGSPGRIAVGRALEVSTADADSVARVTAALRELEAAPTRHEAGGGRVLRFLALGGDAAEIERMGQLIGLLPEGVSAFHIHQIHAEPLIAAAWPGPAGTCIYCARSDGTHACPACPECG
ncbi:MAG TPA: hypothetical protein VIA06_15470 [Candidatus Dormibacteraeota bacterium]|jgi:hypothetical protein|nr:hypothetical protein [Candidatus Dormibacteraeota bacterium]